MNAAPLCLRCLAAARFQSAADCQYHTEAPKPESRRKIVPRESLDWMLPEEKDQRVRDQRRARYLRQTPEQKAAARAKDRRSYERNREARIAAMRERHAANKEQRNAKQRAYYAEHREAINAKRRKR
jgi:hypothetical protein